LRPMLKTDKNTTALICTSRAKKTNKKKIINISLTHIGKTKLTAQRKFEVLYFTI